MPYVQEGNSTIWRDATGKAVWEGGTGPSADELAVRAHETGQDKDFEITQGGHSQGYAGAYLTPKASGGAPAAAAATPAMGGDAGGGGGGGGGGSAAGAPSMDSLMNMGMSGGRGGGGGDGAVQTRGAGDILRPMLGNRSYPSLERLLQVKTY